MKLLTILIVAFFLFLPAQNIQADSSGGYLDYVQDRTVFVYKSCEDKSKSGWGTGTIIEGTKVLTAEHVVDDRKDCQIFVRREKEKFHAALVLKEDSKVDLALLVVSHDYKLETQIAESRLGEELVNVSYPVQLLDYGTPYLSVLFGYVSTKDIKASGDRCLDRISVDIYFGSSGSCVFNSVGQCVGVVSAGHMDRGGYNYTSRGQDVIDFLQVR